MKIRLATIRDRSRKSSRQAGFTLVEMLVVLAIIGMVAALVGPQVIGYLGDAKADTAHVQVENMDTALDLFRLDIGRYPTEQEGLAALVTPPSGLARWKGPYLKARGVPLDPWGRPYAYRSPGRHGPYDLDSLGPDGTSVGDQSANDRGGAARGAGQQASNE